MAGKPKQPNPPKGIRRIDRGSTGIYQNGYLTGNSATAKAWISGQDNLSLVDRLPAMREALAEFLDHLVGKGNWCCHYEKRTRVPLVWTLDTFAEHEAPAGGMVNAQINRARLDNLTPQMREAAEESMKVLGLINLVKECIAGGEAGLAATWAFNIGELWERIHVRHYEPSVERDISHRRKSEWGTAALAEKTNRDAELTKAAYLQEKVNGVSFTAATNRAATSRGISNATAKRHLKRLGITAKESAK